MVEKSAKVTHEGVLVEIQPADAVR